MKEDKVLNLLKLNYQNYQFCIIKSVLSKNPGLSQVKKISGIISREKSNDDEDLVELLKIFLVFVVSIIEVFNLII